MKKTLFGFFAMLNVAAFAAGGATPTPEDIDGLSEVVEVRGWKREQLTVEALPEYVEATNAEARATALAASVATATNAITAKLTPIMSKVTAIEHRPIVMVTGAAGYDNLLDRENLTMAVVSNDVTVGTDGTRHVSAWIAMNKRFASAPKMRAKAKTHNGRAYWTEGNWTDYGGTGKAFNFTHQQAYTNFVVATVTNNATSITTTNVVVESIEEGDRLVVTTNRVHRYDLVEYLEGDGYAYFDTGIVFDGTMAFDIDCSFTQEAMVCGSRDRIDGATVGYNGVTLNAGTMWLTLNLGNTQFELTRSGEKNRRYSVQARDGTSYFDGVAISTPYGPTFANKNWYLLTMNHNGAAMTGTRAQSRIYEFRFYKDGEVSHDYVPIVTSDDTPKLWDTTTDTELAKSGSGTIATGAVTGEVFSVTYVTNTVHYCITNTTTTTIPLTNEVITVFDGVTPRIVNVGDVETLTGYELKFDIPKSANKNLSVDLQRWVKVGDAETGFNFGNRQLRVNDALTFTTNDCAYLGNFTTAGGTSLTNDFKIFIDNGIFKLAERGDE